MAAKLLRYFALLELLPPYPRKATPQDLREDLARQGVAVTERTVQRDLQWLKRSFPLRCDDRNAPYGWGWEPQAHLPLPRHNAATALTFVLAGAHLRRLLPPSVQDPLEPYIASAEQALDQMAPALRSWRDKVRVLSRWQPLQPPMVDSEVLETIYEALLRERRLQARYCPRQGSPKEYEVNPLGLVLRDQVGYLVGTLWEYDDLKHFALHRFEDAELLEQARRTPPGFDLDAYLQSGAFEIVDGAPIRLELRIGEGAAFHLGETPLSSDQGIEPLGEDDYRLTATVANTEQLRWWLLGFGELVEVLAPVELRAEFAARAAALAARYVSNPGRPTTESISGD